MGEKEMTIYDARPVEGLSPVVRLAALLSWLAVAVLSLVSLYATGRGFQSVLGRENSALMVPIAFTLSAVVQVMIWRFWHRVFGMKSTWQVLLLNLALAITLSIVSGVLASGTYLIQMKGGEVKALFDGRTMSGVTEPLKEMVKSYRATALAMEDFAGDAVVKAAEEEQFGGTCPGVTSGKTCGYRCEMRKRVAKEAQEKAMLARSIAAEAADLVANGARAGNQSQMDDIWARSASLYNDPRNGDIRRTLAGLRSDFQENFKAVYKGKPLVFECRDERSIELLSSAIETLESRAEPSGDAPQEMTLTYTAAVGIAQQGVWALLSLWFGDVTDVDEELLELSAVALGLAAFLEMFLAALIVVDVLNRGANSRVYNVLQGDPMASVADKAMLRERYLSIMRHIVQEGDRWFLLVPHILSHPFDQEAKAARLIADAWKLKSWRGAPVVDIDDIFPIHPEYRALQAGEVRTPYRVYVLAATHRKLLRRMAQAAGL